MFDVKRVGFLFFLTLLIGLALVHLRTRHMQRVHEITVLAEQEQQLRQAIWRQHGRLSGCFESPGEVRRLVERADLSICPLGGKTLERTMLANRDENMVERPSDIAGGSNR